MAQTTTVPTTGWILSANEIRLVTPATISDRTHTVVSTTRVMMILRAPEFSEADFMSFLLVSPRVVLVQPSLQRRSCRPPFQICRAWHFPCRGREHAVDLLLVPEPRFADN